MTSPQSLGGPADQRLSDGWSLDADAPARLRRSDGLTTQPLFVDGDLFSVTHSPSGPPIGTVVICPPLYAEAVRNQRRELALGWELSAAGFEAVRFHYRGTGHSAGDYDDVRLDTLARDALRVTAATRRPDTPVAFVGTRVGGFAAARAAAEHPGSPLALWAPVTDVEAYMTELRRARMIGLLREGKDGNSKNSVDDFSDAGFMDVVGHPVSLALYESLVAAPLAELVERAGPRPILAVQMSRRSQLRPELSQLIDRWQTGGLDASAAVASYDEAWWFGASGYSVVEVEAGGLDTIPMTVDFLTEAIR